jgi:hypothetical protein
VLEEETTNGRVARGVVQCYLVLIPLADQGPAVVQRMAVVKTPLVDTIAVEGALGGIGGGASNARGCGDGGDAALAGDEVEEGQDGEQEKHLELEHLGCWL